MSAENEFEKIATDTSSQAARVKCPPAEYRDGLLVIIERLEADIAASEETDPAE